MPTTDSLERKLEQLAHRIVDDDVRAPSAIVRVLREAGLLDVLKAGQACSNRLMRAQNYNCEEATSWEDSYAKLGEPR
jgi:hypothetical protein